ncbi:MAG: wax ester/triacylglycerol synthase domain-containing protein, partial [Solirubrobacteraceae bacterium]
MTVVRPLSDEDAAILAIESDRIAGHTCKLLRLGTPPEGGAAALRAQIAARLADAPELQWRLGEDAGALAWVVEGDLDLEHHVRAVPGPLDTAALRAHAASLMASRLDRDRPLWSIDVVERLDDGGAAVFFRIHHALADGSTAMRLGRAVLWDEEVPGASLRSPSTQTRPAPPPPHFSAALAHEILPGSSAHTPLAGHVGSRRTVATATTALETVKAIAHARARAPHATVNDVVLAAVAGGMRRWLLHHHGPLPAVRVKVPVSLHQPGEDAGNRDSFFAVDLHLAEADPVARLDAIHADADRRKHDGDALALDELLRGLGRRAPALAHLVRRWESSARVFALNVSNVPGPKGIVHVLGSPARAMHSLVEVGDHHLLRVAVVSMGGELGFGLCADADAVSDLDVFAAGIEAELEELAGGGGG